MTRLEIAVQLLTAAERDMGLRDIRDAFNDAEDILRYEAQLLLDGSGYKDVEAARLDLIEQARAKDEAEEQAKRDEELPF